MLYIACCSVSIHVQEGFKRRPFDSQKRDEQITLTVERAAGKLYDLLVSEDSRAKDVVAALLRSTGLDGRRGPNRAVGPLAPEGSRALAVKMATESAAALEVALGRKATPTRGAASIGLPLIGAFCHGDIASATGDLIARSYGPTTPGHERIAVLLGRRLRDESELWALAHDLGGPSPTIPFAYRVAAAEWLVTPKVNRHPGAQTICLRCGLVYSPTRESHSGRCDSCSKEKTREWPQHAAAPAGRGVWWLRCPGRTVECLGTFVGRRNTKWCPACDTSKIAPGKRRVKALTGARRHD